MRVLGRSGYNPAVTTHSTAVVVSDAHLGAAPDEVSEAFHRFLGTVPDLGDHLIINGDLFDFWFEYRHVIPRAHFATLEALARVRREGIALTVVGGNHDRWGSRFWQEELGATFFRRTGEIELAGWRTWLSHGDGVAESDLGGRIIHRVVGHGVTAKLFSWLHPDLGFALVRRMSKHLGSRRDDEDTARRAVATQERYATKIMAERQELDVIILGHTHRPVLQLCGERRWYLNPGAWMDGFRYAVISRDGPELRSFS